MVFGLFGTDFKTLKEEELKDRLSKKRIIVIGGTSGIGKALAAACLKRGSEVTVLGRKKPDDQLKGAKGIQKDLKLMNDVIELKKELETEKYDIVVFTNGIITTPERKETSEGIEEDLAISYLSRFNIFKNILKGKIGTQRKDKSCKPRIFVMGYPGTEVSATIDDFNSEKDYKAIAAHMNTVVANEALVQYIAENDPNVNAYGLNPGLIQTDIRNNYFGKDSWLSYVVEGIIKYTCQSAETYAENVLVHLMVSPEYENSSKTLFNSSGAKLNANSFVTKNYAKLISESERLLQKALGKK